MSCEEKRKKKKLRCAVLMGEKEWKREWGRKLVPVWHSSTGLISFCVLSISLRHLSRQKERVREVGRDSERGNKQGRKKGSGLVERCRAIDLGLTVRGTDRDTDRCVVQFSQPFCLIYQPHYQPLFHSPSHTSLSHVHMLHIGEEITVDRQDERERERQYHWHYRFKYGWDRYIKGRWGSLLHS